MDIKIKGIHNFSFCFTNMWIWLFDLSVSNFLVVFTSKLKLIDIQNWVLPIAVNLTLMPQKRIFDTHKLDTGLLTRKKKDIYKPNYGYL